MEKKPRVFPLRVGEDIHGKIEQALAKSILKSKHEWIEKAIQEKIDRENTSLDKKTIALLQRAHSFIRGGPAPDLENDIREHCELLSRR